MKKNLLFIILFIFISLFSVDDVSADSKDKIKIATFYSLDGSGEGYVLADNKKAICLFHGHGWGSNSKIEECRDGFAKVDLKNQEKDSDFCKLVKNVLGATKCTDAEKAEFINEIKKIVLYKKYLSDNKVDVTTNPGYSILQRLAWMLLRNDKNGMTEVKYDDKYEFGDRTLGSEWADPLYEGAVSYAKSKIGSFDFDFEDEATIYWNMEEKCQPALLLEKSPSITVECFASEGEYGKCSLIIKQNGNQIEEAKVDCNEFNEIYQKKIGKSTPMYKSYNLSSYCPYNPKYPYDITSECTNCDSTNTDSSYNVKDTSDWTAIIHSTIRNDKTSTLQKYFKLNNDDNTLCRTELNVNFPNKGTIGNSKIKTGRYFTINEYSNDSDGNTDYMTNATNLFNFAPIKASITKECISLTGQDLTSTLSNYLASTDFNKEFGSVELKYVENYTNSIYNKNNIFELYVDKDRTKIEQLIIGTTGNIDTTFAGSNKPSNISSSYKTYKQTVTTYLKFGNKNKKSDTSDGIYRYVANGNVTSGGKTYNAGESAREKPTGSNLDDKFIDLGLSTLPISFNNTSEGATVSLSYKLEMFKEAVKNGVDYLEKNPTENITDNRSTINKNSKKCLNNLSSTSNDNKFKYYICKLDIGPTCEITYDRESNKTIYYCADGNECEYTEYKKTCPQEGDECDYIDYCHETVGVNSTCCTVGKSYGMICSNNDGTCPTKSGYKVIYRTIDLNNPFPYISGKGRETGDNWCYSSNGVVSCSKNNQTVQSYITNIGKKIYNEEPLYIINLDRDGIKKLKAYNKKHEYGDWTLKKSNNVYKSTIVEEYAEKG